MTILLLRRWAPLVPGSLLVVLLGIGAVSALDLDERGLEIVGAIEAGLPHVGVPDLSLGEYLDLVGPAVGVVLIGFVEGLGAAKTYALRTHDDIDPSRELIGMGTANLGAGAFNGMVVNGSLSKTAVNASAGARTQVSGLVVGGLTVLTLLFLTGLFEQLPEAVLAAVVIAAVIELVDFAALRRLYDVWTRHLGTIYRHAARIDFIAAVGTMLGVLVWETLPGLFIGIVLSVLTLLYRVSRPHVPPLARQPGAAGLWLDAARHPDLRTDPRVLVVRVEAGLFFANADYVRDRVRDVVTTRTRAVVVDGETMPFVDVSAASMLAQLADELRAQGVTLAVAGEIGQVRDVVRTAPASTGPRLFPDVDAAYDAVVEQMGGEPED